MNKTINNIDIEITESVTSEFIISLNSIFHKDLTCKILKNIKKHLTDNNLKKNLLRDIELVDYLEIGNLVMKILKFQFCRHLAIKFYSTLIFLAA